MLLLQWMNAAIAQTRTTRMAAGQRMTRNLARAGLGDAERPVPPTTGLAAVGRYETCRRKLEYMLATAPSPMYAHTVPVAASCMRAQVFLERATIGR